MPRILRRLFLVVVFALTANADIVLDQEQPLIDTKYGRWVLGGLREQKLAQTVTAGISGRLVEVHVPVACGNGEVILEIRHLTGDAPTGRMVSIELIRAGEIARYDDPPVFHRFVIDPAPRFEAGDRFAISLRDKTGECGMWVSPAGDSYRRGEGWLIDNVPPTDVWTRVADTGTPFEDLPFKTFVDTTPAPPPPRPRPSSPPCTVTGFGPIPFIPAWMPVCRCLQDSGLRELRCALFHPDFFLVRRIPWPLKPAEQFTVTWTLVPLGAIKGLEVREALNLKGPLTFFVDQLPPGESVTLEYQAVAGAAGDTKIESEIIVFRPGQQPETGQIRTVLEAGPKP